LSGRLKENSLFEVYDRLDRPLVRVLTDMERVGVSVNLERLKELSAEMHDELKQGEAHCRQLLVESGLELAPDFNLASPKQVAHVLYEKLQLPVVKRTKTGPSTDVKALEEISHLHPFPSALLELRELAKLLSTYIDALPTLVNSETHRLHTDFSQTVAATGRLSSSNPNLQNIPIRTERGRKIRDAFTAAPGNCLVGVDYSQVELRILAHMSQDPELLRAFREDVDIHRRTAALVLKRPENEVSDDERRMAKGINFGIVYGQTAFGLSKALKIPRAHAQKFIDNYFQTYPGIKNYMERAVAEAKDTGAVRTLTGRRRFIPEIRSSNHAIRQFGERMAINSPIQGTAADLMKAAMIAVQKELAERFPGARLVLQVHDELLIEVPHGEAQDLKLWVKETLEDPALLESFGIQSFAVVMKAEASVGNHWGEL
jgi:DNA polymerase-1